MGLNTTIVIQNDSLPFITDNPKGFVSTLDYAIQSGDHQPLDGLGVQLVATRHASITHVVSTGGNNGVFLGSVCTSNTGTEESKLDILRQLADQMGYTLRKKPA